MLDRAQEMGLDTFPLEVRGEPEAAQLLGRWLKETQVQIFHAHAGVAWEGHDGIRAAQQAGVAGIVRTEHLPDLTVVFALEDLPDLIYSPYHRPDHRLSRESLTELVARDRAEHRRLVEHVDRVICVSAAVRDSFAHVGVPPEKLRVVRNGIRPRPAECSAAEARSRLGIPASTGIVLTIGRLIDVKAYPYLLEAVPAVVQRHPDVCFLWVGSGPQEQELRERVQALGLEEVVHLAGQRSDMPDLLAAADLFVLPSLVEGLPLGVLEAMAAGLPVVGTRVSGTSEVVVDGVTGRLVAPGRLTGPFDTTALAAAILEPLEDPRLGARWGEAGRRRVEQEFTVMRMARETADVYAELLG